MRSRRAPSEIRVGCCGSSGGSTNGVMTSRSIRWRARAPGASSPASSALVKNSAFAGHVPRRDRVLTHVIDPAGAPTHHGRVPLHLLRMLAPSEGCRDVAARLDMRLSAAERRIGRARLLHAVGERADSPLIGFFANATGRKNYAPEWWRAVSTQLRRLAPSARFVEFIPADGLARLAAQMPGVRSPDLRILAAMIAATDRMVVADSGVMHLAFAAKARVLALFKVTDPDQYGPMGDASQALRVHDHEPELAAAAIHAGLERPRPMARDHIGRLSA